MSPTSEADPPGPDSPATATSRALRTERAAATHFRINRRAAGNGSLMRASTSAVHFARAGQSATMDAARRISALTHGDPAAGEGTAVFHELVRRALPVSDPRLAVPEVLDLVHPEHRRRYATVLAADWHPDRATEFNGAVWPCLGSAVWALRSTTGFEEAIRGAAGISARVITRFYSACTTPVFWQACSSHLPSSCFVMMYSGAPSVSPSGER
ncbi:hypothetical protein GCM10010232_10880 [Streptomyces amakusaensis]